MTFTQTWRCSDGRKPLRSEYYGGSQAQASVLEPQAGGAEEHRSAALLIFVQNSLLGHILLIKVLFNWHLCNGYTIDLECLISFLNSCLLKNSDTTNVS